MLIPCRWNMRTAENTCCRQPHGELLFGIFGFLAQYERALTQERVIAGLAVAKRRG